MRIVLASASPRRKVLLDQAGLDFEVFARAVEEEIGPGKTPEELVLRNAEKKTMEAAKAFEHRALFIGADTVVALGDEILGKPNNPNAAFTMLRSLSGREHMVYTGVCLFDSATGNKRLFAESAYVQMKELTDGEIQAYIDTNEPMDKAGSYGLQGRGAVFVSQIHGDYTTVVGLPLCALYREIKNMGLGHVFFPSFSPGFLRGER